MSPVIQSVVKIATRALLQANKTNNMGKKRMNETTPAPKKEPLIITHGDMNLM